MGQGLNVTVGKLKLKNPVIVASGTWGEEYESLMNASRLGAIVAKTVTLKPRMGNPPPRIVETAAGMLNSIGLENKGIEDFLKNKLPKLKRFNIPIIASVAGDDASEFRELARILDKAKDVDALELNLSCPNIKYGLKEGLIAQDAAATHEVVKAVRGVTRSTVIAKLSPNVTDIGKIAKAAEDAGADAVSLVNTFLGMAVDIDTKRPVLGNVTGGLSGPAIKPIALRMVREVHNKVDIPIIGIGGIMDYKDAVEFFLCGATAIQVGTANFVDPKAALGIIDGLKKYLSQNRISDMRKLIGRLKIGTHPIYLEK